MGNIFVSQKSKSTSAQTIDLHRKIISFIEAPITAAELMLENPGYVLSPVSALRSEKRLSALKADELLAGGRAYLLIPVNRVNGRVSESEMAAIESVCAKKSSRRRRSSKVQHAVSLSEDESSFAAENKSENGSLRPRARQWKPALEPIFE